MTVKSLAPASPAARMLVAALFALTALPLAAQEEAPPAGPEATAAPAETPAPESTEAPAEPAVEAPAEAAAAAPEQIPVEAEAESGSVKLDTLQVTGSRIKRTDFETAQPVVVVTRDDIERTGLTNIGDILQRLPAAGSSLNRTFNNGGAGTTEIDLRNLGSNRVLVLVNGQRWVNGTSFANTSAVDLNTIPVSIIERVEVLKDGASAIYGSDAIAGVVNIITRKDITGIEMGTQLQAFDDGNGLIQNYHASIGTVADKTSMFFDLNFVRQGGIL